LTEALSENGYVLSYPDGPTQFHQ